jgi:hypothetical protein
VLDRSSRLFGRLVRRMALQRPKPSDPAHKDVRLQPQRDGRACCSAWSSINSVLFLLFPSPPGIVKPQWRTDEANPCQRRRFCKHPTGKSGIDRCSDKVDIPRHFPLFVHNCVGMRCHSSPSCIRRCLEFRSLAAHGDQTGECAGLVESVLDMD